MDFHGRLRGVIDPADARLRPVPSEAGTAAPRAAASAGGSS
ncbi:hypothetical protein [Streptomyces sp. NPDC056628]